MPISEKKMQIVIKNYFDSECDINTSIREAFENGFRIGVLKGYEVGETDAQKKERLDNPILSWDELKQMEGKPVWVETEMFFPRWYLTEAVDSETVFFVGVHTERVPLHFDGFGKTWIAYRKERE